MYGSPKTYPYYYKIYKDGKIVGVSGVYKTKREAIKSARYFTAKSGEDYRIFKRKGR